VSSLQLATQSTEWRKERKRKEKKVKNEIEKLLGAMWGQEGFEKFFVIFYDTIKHILPCYVTIG
jgi:hypothetical protein